MRTTTALRVGGPLVLAALVWLGITVATTDTPTVGSGIGVVDVTDPAAVDHFATEVFVATVTGTSDVDDPLPYPTTSFEAVVLGVGRGLPQDLDGVLLTVEEGTDARPVLVGGTYLLFTTSEPGVEHLLVTQAIELDGVAFADASDAAVWGPYLPVSTS